MYRILQRPHSRVRGRDLSIIVEDRGGGKRPYHLKTSGPEGRLEKVALPAFVRGEIQASAVNADGRLEVPGVTGPSSPTTRAISIVFLR